MATLSASQATGLFDVVDYTGLTTQQIWDSFYAPRFNDVVIANARRKRRANIVFVYDNPTGQTAMTTLAELQAILVPLGYTVHGVTVTNDPPLRVRVLFSY